jgi:hypothetical protein
MIFFREHPKVKWMKNGVPPFMETPKWAKNNECLCYPNIMRFINLFGIIWIAKWL